jgi:Bacterial toxin 23
MWLRVPIIYRDQPPRPILHVMSSDSETSPQKLTRLKTFLLLLFVILTNSYRSQDILHSAINSDGSHFGISVGGNLAIGSHFQRLGINFNFFYANKFFQANSEVRAYFNIKNLGPKITYPELVISQGVLFAYGAKTNTYNPFLNSVSNQTGYENSVAYSFNLYLNPRKQIKTTQQTGIIALQFNTISVITENDLLAKPLLDRFRTGAFLIQYQYLNVFQAAINCTMWTGRMGNTCRGDTSYPAVGYIDTTGGVYTKYSHGLLSAQVKYHLGVSQILQANVGVDSEKIRNAVQNKFIHDVCWLPKNWFKRYNCHIPMLDDKGNQYLYKANQKIKKPKLYWNVYANPNLFY